jgi:hypothetical protein
MTSLFDFLKSGWKTFDNWFFGHGSPVTLGLFRAIFAGLVFINLAFILIYFKDWFSQSGFVPTNLGAQYIGPRIEAFGQTIPRLNVLGGVASDSITLAVYLGTMLAALLTSLGLWTRVSSILLATGLVSLHHRNGLILHGGDTLMRVSVLYLAISPCGAAVSLDQFFARKKGIAPALPQLISLWPQRLLQIQVAILYMTTFWHKMGGHYWKNGTATWYPMHLNEFDRFPLPSFTDSAVFVTLTSWGTLAVQLSFATLVFAKPLRKWVLLAGIGLHGFIDYAFNIPLFSYLMITMYIAFYEGEEIASWWDRTKTRWSINSQKVVTNDSI